MNFNMKNLALAMPSTTEARLHFERRDQKAVALKLDRQRMCCMRNTALPNAVEPGRLHAASLLRLGAKQRTLSGADEAVITCR